MNRKALIVSTVIGYLIGQVVVLVINPKTEMGVWIALGGFVGGMLGVWAGVKVSKWLN